MPEITATHIVLIALAAIAGAIAAWSLRGRRAAQEKAAMSAGWQGQVDAQRKEHERLVEQNKGLMEQISQYQASNKDAKNRAKELSLAVREAFERRDALQREIKDIRSNLESALSARDKLRSDIAERNHERNLLREKDEKIAHLGRELENWQGRLPPLIERFRARDQDAIRLEAELAEARDRIQELEHAGDEGGTRIEPVSDPDELTDGLDASNDADDAQVGASEAEQEDLDQPAGQDASAEAADEAPTRAIPGETEEIPADERVNGFDAGAEPEALAAQNSLRDDLKAIKGVGPAIEKTLNELGIFRFQQIADMSEYDIDRVARHLKGFRSRIYREDWIGQARELHDQRNRA